MDNKERKNQSNKQAEYGEGNYKAAREYQDAVQKTAGSEQSKRAAKRAKEALESPDERAELEAAEKKGRQPGQGVPEK
ncbi:MAG TPA: hypothetical protein VFU02_19850 [Polyangiaceae bacterium]|nr:hypothetical protein [Polyangiaceae bacterium]